MLPLIVESCVFLKLVLAICSILCSCSDTYILLRFLYITHGLCMYTDHGVFHLPGFLWRAVCVKTIFLPKTSVSRAMIRFRGHDPFSRRRFSFRGDEFRRRRFVFRTMIFLSSDEIIF